MDWHVMNSVDRTSTCKRSMNDVYCHLIVDVAHISVNKIFFINNAIMAMYTKAYWRNARVSRDQVTNSCARAGRHNITEIAASSAIALRLLEGFDGGIPQQCAPQTVRLCEVWNAITPVLLGWRLRRWNTVNDVIIITDDLCVSNLYTFPYHRTPQGCLHRKVCSRCS